MQLTITFYNKETVSEFQKANSALFEHLDIYFQPSFLHCDAEMQKGEYEIAVVQSETNRWIYPYILVPIEGTTYFDITAPYGYCGPFTTDSTLHIAAEKLFLQNIRSRGNIVNEFIRYHYDPVLHFTEKCTNLLNRRIVLTDVSQTSEHIWEKQFSGTNRNIVRKLKKEGFEYSISDFITEDVSFFQAFYNETMKNAQATDFYYFDEAFYMQLIRELGPKIKLAKVYKDGVVYATALFFVSGKYVTYYLSARNLDFPKVSASNLLLSETIFWANENQFEVVNLGGGLSLNEDDRLFKFKSNFGIKYADFYIGKRILNDEKYAQLQADFIQKNGEEKFNSVRHILQFYRD